MTSISRRKFVQTSALATGAVGAASALPGAWLGFVAAAEDKGYFETQFGITDALCRKLLEAALAKGGDFADLYFEHTISNSLGLEDGEVNRAFGNIDLGVGIRTVKGDQVGYAFVQDLSEAALLQAAGVAASIADSTAKKCEPRFVPVSAGDYYPMKTLFTAVPVSSKLPIVQAINDRILARSKLTRKVSCGLYDAQKRILVVSSDGRKAEDLLPQSYIYANATGEKDGRKETAGFNLGGRRELSYFGEQRIDELVTKVVNRLAVLFEATQPPAGEMPVVLGPGITGILLHEAIGHGMEADFNRKKVSTYSTMIGKKVAEPFVTIVDDGTNPNLLGSINFDDEGTPGQKTVLVENGILTTYLHDRISANHYKTKPTGNGRRQNYRYYAIPRMRNTYMLSGPATPEDAIKAAKKGIYVEDVANGQVQIGEGDFAFYVSCGRVIEDGKLGAPIKDVNIMGNGPKMLLNVIMVANDMQLYEGGAGQCGKDGQGVPVSFGLPTVLVNSMTVGGVKRQGA
jgi:TldD protein